MKLLLPVLVATAFAAALAVSWIAIEREKNCHGCTASGSAGKDSVSPEAPLPKIHGDPQNAVKAFRNLYKALIGYRKLHGRLPPRTSLLRDTRRPIVPGVQLTKSDLYCVDATHPDFLASGPLSKDPRYGLAWRGKRPNGQRKPDFPKSGEKDIWVISGHYERMRSIRLDGEIFPEYYGVRVGLFSDGSIEVTPVDKLVAVRRSPMAWQSYFPGETGVPKNETASENEMARTLLRESRARSKAQLSEKQGVR